MNDSALGIRNAVLISVALWALGIGIGLFLASPGDELLINADIIAAADAKRACAVTIIQYGPGERWAPPSATPSSRCASFAGAVPNHIMGSPLK